MKFLKVLALFALTALISAPVIRAQDNPSTPPAEGGKKGGRGRGGMSPEQRLADIDKAVTLTDDQKAKVKDILTKAQADMQALSPEDRRTKGREIMQSSNDQIRALLTDDQKTKFDAMPRPGRGGKKKQEN